MGQDHSSNSKEDAYSRPTPRAPPSTTRRRSRSSTPELKSNCSEMADFLKGVELEKKDGSKVLAEEALKGKVVALYFSAHWCPPCRAFTPVLKDFHGELEDGGEFEVVFVSFDRSVSDLKSYMAECHGDWYHIPFGSEKIQELSTKYGVSGIPALIIIRADGSEITKNGRNDVQSKPPAAALAGWKSA